MSRHASQAAQNLSRQTKPAEPKTKPAENIDGFVSDLSGPFRGPFSFQNRIGRWRPAGQRSSVLKVSQARRSPVCRPFLNQRTRWAEVP